jgi:hypothetical protein
MEWKEFFYGPARRVWLIANLCGLVALGIGVVTPDDGAWRAIQFVFLFAFIAGYVVCSIWWLYASLKNRRQPT